MNSSCPYDRKKFTAIEVMKHGGRTSTYVFLVEDEKNYREELKRRNEMYIRSSELHRKQAMELRQRCDERKQESERLRRKSEECRQKSNGGFVNCMLYQQGY